LPRAGRLIAAGGHAHGGSKGLAISQPRCGNRVLMRSRPLFGRPDHPYYHVLPVLHEPGPIDLSWNETGSGIPVARGERLRLSSYYDGQVPHTRVMGIMHLYVAYDDRATASCGALPGDLTNERLDYAGRTRPPLVRVPLTGIGRDGVARTIPRAPGRVARLKRGATIAVKRFRFSRRELSIPLGARLRWRFGDGVPHNVTVANGPLGFASQNHRRGGRFYQRFRKAGRYNLFCSLHPVQMTQTVVVRRRR
jgi:plastocyanin